MVVEIDEPEKQKEDTEVSEESDNYIKESIKKNKKLLKELENIDPILFYSNLKKSTGNQQ